MIVLVFPTTVDKLASIEWKRTRHCLRRPIQHGTTTQKVDRNGLLLQTSSWRASMSSKPYWISSFAYHPSTDSTRSDL